MLTDLVQIRRLGERQQADNAKFRAWLKRHSFVERKLKAIASDVEDKIDCTACANCCRVATTQVTDRDLERLSRFLGMKPKEVIATYTQETEDEGRILKRNENGCMLLEGNLCSVYEARPEACQLFPHLVKGTGSFLSRMWHMPDRAVYCPIVYNTLEAYKEETGYRK